MSFNTDNLDSPFQNLFAHLPLNDGSSILRPFENFNIKNDLFSSHSILPTNVYSEDNTIHMLVAVAGCTKDDIEVSFKAGRLTVSTKTEKKEENENKKYFFCEFTTSQSRSYVLPKGVRAEDITINFENGLLHIQFPANKEDETIKLNF